MAKLYPEMVAIGRPARREPALRRGAAYEAVACCCRLLNAMLDERYPDRIADPSVLGDLSARVKEMHEAFFEKAAFLFDVALLRGLKEEPTQSLMDAFDRLADSETVHNVNGGHEPWRDWYTVHFGDYRIGDLFDEKHAEAVNPANDPALTELFARVYTFMQRIESIIRSEEETVSTYILDIMPDVLRLSLEGSIDYEKMAYDKPWMSIAEEYGVYRHKLAKELGKTERSLANYERAGKTPKSSYWPKPLNPEDGPGKKYYNPMHVLKALSALPEDFSKATRVSEVIAKLMGNKLASKIPHKPKKTPARDA
ncbi:MAG: hypothetical protein LIQ30_03840 [Planctomycetes bacterium]|nr:hypothetical protein [Planctomycetota bacterium]MCD7895352.1 hypothetical protein [Planctomycetaceae bacterium]